MQWFTKFKPRRSKSDIEEDVELSRKSDNEPMPKNISDFKNHPVFALERHLRRNEVVWPNEHRGNISVGNKGGKPEKVYDRKNVHIVRSADQWYRKGRDLKVGEQPLKRVVTQKRRGMSVDEDAEGEAPRRHPAVCGVSDRGLRPAACGEGSDTEESVRKSRCLRTEHDPRLARYISSTLRRRNAARILGIDFTEAVTGFKFKGRQGTAVINGISSCSGIQRRTRRSGGGVGI